MAKINAGIVECSSAILTLPGESECGDKHTVIPISGGVLAAVVDGLGHGPEAAAAADRAIATINSYARTDTLTSLVRRCNVTLHGTRGVVMSLAIFNADERTMTWLGVGDVEGRLIRKTAEARYAHQNLLLRSGVVGQHLPRLQAPVVGIGRGDMLIFATDGIYPDFADEVDINDDVSSIADHIVSAHGKTTDDALALVVRYIG